MSTEKMKTCTACGEVIAKSAKACPKCGAKNKKPIYQRPWFIALIAIVILIAISGGGSDGDSDGGTSGTSNNPNSTTSEGGTTTEKEDDNTIAVGESFEKSKLKITVNEADTDFTNYDDAYGWNTPADGMKYIMVSFTFENGSDSDKYVSIYDFACYADNTACEQVYTLADNSFIAENISSGRNISFKTYYAVPVDAKEIELEYETNFWTDKKVIIKVQ